jgi:predicted acylesterase/phospholipase RssA
MDKINTLVFEGGGIYGYAYIGALKELQSRLEFSKIKYLCGSSAGALMAYALALGLKSHQIEDVVNKFRTQLLLRIPELAFKLPWNTFINYGLISNDIVRDIALLTLKASHIDKEDITFKELERDLIITGTNLSDSYFFVCSKQTTPNMSVIDAVVNSCCGNIALTPTRLKIRKQNKYVYIIDGGASVLNYPIAIFSENTNPSYITNMLDNDYSRDLYAQFGGNWKELEEIIRDKQNILLGLNFKSIDPYVNIPIRNVFSFVWNLINVTYQSLLLATDRDTRYTITIDMGSILPFDLRYIFIPYKTKQMIEMGREAVRNFKPCH